MDYIITHYPDNKRFETQVDGVVAFVQYRLSGDKLDIIQDRKSTRLNSSHRSLSRMPSSA